MIMVALRLWMSSAIVMRRRKLVGAFSRNAPRGACICYPDSRIMRTDYARSGRRTHNDRSDRRKAARLAATHRPASGGRAGRHRRAFGLGVPPPHPRARGGGDHHWLYRKARSREHRPRPRRLRRHQDRKSVVSGKSVSVRVDLGGSRSIKKKKKQEKKNLKI